MKYIYCHPLFDERKCSHRFSYYLEKIFGAHGLAFQRFDYEGTGEAEGEFSDVTLETIRENLTHQIGREENFSLIGVRFGASLAFDYCCREPRKVRNLILIEPILNGSDYIAYLYRKQRIKDLMTGQTSPSLYTDSFFNFEGYKTNTKLVEQISAVSLPHIAKDCAVNNSIWVIQISSPLKMNSQFAELAQHLRKVGQTVFLEHLNIKAFWERIPLIDCTQAATQIWEWCHG